MMRTLSSTFPAFRFALLATAMLALPFAPARADTFASPPVKGDLSTARLLSAGAPEGGAYRAGVEIALNPRSITYWRQPGEAGMAPLFDFSKSENVARVEVAFPAPKHIDEAGTIVAGYDASVIFPLRVTPRDPAAPVKLKLLLDYGACGKVCLPAKADLTLALAQTGASPHVAAIAAAESKVPQKLDAAGGGQRFALARLDSGVPGSWRLRALGAPARDVFVEVAEPLFAESKADGDGFEITLFSTGAMPKSANATVTIVTDQGAFEAPARLE